MIHLIGDYAMDTDGLSYIVGRARQRAAGHVSLEGARYYSSLPSALAAAAERAACDKVAAGELTTLQAFIDEYQQSTVQLKDAVLQGMSAK